MDARLTYLLIDIGSILVPLIYSFHPKLNFYRTWNRFWPANLLTVAVFISWDSWFTERGVWGFDARYVSGIEVASLPLEEWFFFVAIPYASVFTYAALGQLMKRELSGNVVRVITIGLVLSLACVGIVNRDRAYTGLTFLALSLFLMVHQLLQSNFLGRFYVAYAVILIPFFIVNGLLTGTGIDGEVVWYNNLENLGVRIGTIPLEDIFYGMLLILLNVTLYEWFKPLQERFLLPARLRPGVDQHIPSGDKVG